MSDPEADRRRLDWLESWDWLQVFIPPCEADWPDSARWALAIPGDPAIRVAGPTLRATIDAAMAEWAARETPDV